MVSQERSSEYDSFDPDNRIKTFLDRHPWYSRLSVEIDRVRSNKNIAEVVAEAMAYEEAWDRHTAELECKLQRTRRERDYLALQLKEAHTDSMTECLTKDGFQAALSQRDQDIVAQPPLGTLIAFIDGDGIKALNDTLGHNVGDIGIAEIANRIKHGLRTEDIVARLGGDEFALVLDIRDGEHGEAPLNPDMAAIQLKDRLRHIELNLDDKVIEIGASIGFHYIEGVATAADIVERLKLADEEMYENKRARKDSLRFLRRMGRRAVARLRGSTS